MSVRMLNNLIGVTKAGKPSRSTDGLFSDTDSTQNLGVIRYLGEDVADKFKIGQKIYFGNKREEIRIKSEEIIVMDEDNVFAVVEEDSNEETQKEAQSS